MIIKIKVYIHELLGGCVIMILHDKLLIVYLEKSILREVYIIKSIYDCHISCMTIPFYTITYISWNDLNEQKHAKKDIKILYILRIRKFSWTNFSSQLLNILILCFIEYSIAETALEKCLYTRKNLFKLYLVSHRDIKR